MTHSRTRWRIYAPPPCRNLHLHKSLFFFTPRISIFANPKIVWDEMIARPMTRFDSTPRKIDGGTFFRNPARAATSASGSVVTMIYVSRLFFVIDTPSQMASTDGSSTNEEISGVIDGYATIGCSIRFQKKKKKKSEREKRGEEAWKKKNEKREREREKWKIERTRFWQLAFDVIKIWRVSRVIRKRFSAHKVAACNLLSVLYAPR